MVKIKCHFNIIFIEFFLAIRIIIQRNSGIGGFLKEHFQGKPVPVKIQGDYETVEDAIEKLERASRGKDYNLKIVIQTKETGTTRLFSLQTDVEVIKSLELQAKELANNLQKHN